MESKVITLDNKDAGAMSLADEVFALAVRPDILHRMVNWQLAKRQAGTHKTKERNEIQGSTGKIYRQKGTGRARHGSRKAPIFVGGGVAFGPRVRSHAHKLPKKVRRLALTPALSAKQADGKLIVLENIKLDAPKTGGLARQLAALGWTSVLVIDGTQVDTNFQRAAANLPGVDVLPCQGANVYDILRRDTLVLTKAAVAALEARLK